MVKNTPNAFCDSRALPSEKSTEMLIIVTSEHRTQRAHTSAEIKDGGVESNESHGRFSLFSRHPLHLAVGHHCQSWDNSLLISCCFLKTMILAFTYYNYKHYSAKWEGTNVICSQDVFLSGRFILYFQNWQCFVWLCLAASAEFCHLQEEFLFSLSVTGDCALASHVLNTVVCQSG